MADDFFDLLWKLETLDRGKQIINHARDAAAELHTLNRNVSNNREDLQSLQREVKNIKDVLERDPLAKRLDQIRVLYKSEIFDETQKHLESLISDFPDRLEPRLLLIAVYLRIGELFGAEREFEKVKKLGLQPKVEAQLGLQIYSSLGNPLRIKEFQAKLNSVAKQELDQQLREEQKRAQEQRLQGIAEERKRVEMLEAAHVKSASQYRTSQIGAFLTIAICILVLASVWQKEQQPPQPPVAVPAKTNPPPPVAPKPLASATPGNVLKNGNFEEMDGTFAAGWQFVWGKQKAISFEVENNNRFLRYTFPHQEGVLISRRIKLDPKWARLKVSARLRGKNVQKGAPQPGETGDWHTGAVLYVFYSAQNKRVSEYFKLKIDHDQGWTLTESSEAIPSGAAEVEIQCANMSGSGIFDFDDVAVVPLEK